MQGIGYSARESLQRREKEYGDTGRDCNARDMLQIVLVKITNCICPNFKFYLCNTWQCSGGQGEIQGEIARDMLPLLPTL